MLDQMPCEMKWFGPTWLAQICSECEHVETPVGRPCLCCGIEIKNGDRGLMIHGPGNGYEPWHLRCLMDHLGVPALFLE